MEWSEWKGKRIFVKRLSGDCYTGKCLDVDDNFLQVLDKYGNKVTDFEIGLVRTDGDLAWVSVTAMNGDDYIIGSFTDITRRKNLEAEVEKYEALACESLLGINKDIAQRLEEFDRLFSK